jgi:predicted ArsR family transcriptional regulator
MSEVISFTQHVLKKDLEAYSQALFKQVQALQLENAMLQSKLEHLEELLKSSESIPIIGSK